LVGKEAEDPTVVVTGTLLVNNLYAYVLFNSGATHSVVNSEFANKLTSELDEIDI